MTANQALQDKNGINFDFASHARACLFLCVCVYFFTTVCLFVFNESTGNIFTMSTMNTMYLSMKTEFP